MFFWILNLKPEQVKTPRLRPASLASFSGIDLDAALGWFPLELTYDGAAGGAAASLFCCAAV